MKTIMLVFGTRNEVIKMCYSRLKIQRNTLVITTAIAEKELISIK